MEWQHWLGAPGLRLSSPHTCSPISSGGARTITLCVLTKHYAWCSCSHESEGANGRRNATGNVRKLWQLAEPTVDGQHVRCSLAPCRRFPLERLTSQMGVLYYVAGRWMKVPAAKLVWSLTQGREGLSGLPHHKKPAQSGLTEGWVIYPPYRMGVPSLTMKHLYVVVLLVRQAKRSITF